MKILGIETSCDETAASVIEVKNNKVQVLSNIIASQISIHQKYGGVVPEVAAREHVAHTLPVINEALEKANCLVKNKTPKIDAIAVSTGPGLMTSLIVGVETAKTMSYVWDKPLIAVNHVVGHIFANFITQPEIKFPAVALTVSGGHTLLVLMKNYHSYKIIGETLDDAAGEAFDKAAKMLNIGYPGGPIVAKYAEQFSGTSDLKLPRPMINSKNYDFSFSGLKTALLYKIQANHNWQDMIPEYCFDFENAICETLISKTIKAATDFKAKTIMLCGGVSANKNLRHSLPAAITKKLPQVKFVMPDLAYTTDNATMIAMAGHYKSLKKQFTPWNKIQADCNLEIK